MSKLQKRNPLRINVLALILTGYGVVLFIFGGLAWGDGMTAEEAYEIVQGPLMTLIGGSLALAKDLIRTDDVKSTPKQPVDDPPKS